MKIYKHEKDLEQTILAAAKTTASLTVPIRVSKDKTDVFINSLEGIKKNGCVNDKVGKMVASMADQAHPDLMYGSAILVSTVVNKNDDMFLPTETWDARWTPVNTPYNDEHVDVDIIGHIIASRPLDSEGQLIEAETPPGYFDIEVDFVVYKGIFPAIAAEILDKAPKGEKFVSMEARFNDFDYGIYDPEKKSWAIVARNDETSFLTKYLRAYGGEGLYKENRLARVPRGFRFSGMANVSRPANPASEYTRFTRYELASKNSVTGETGPKVVLYITKGNIMKLETLEQAEKEIERLASKLEEYETKEGKAKIDTLEAEKTTLAGQVTAEKENVRLAQEEITKLKAKVTELEGLLEASKTEASAKASELEKITKERKTAERVSQLQAVGYPIPDDKKKNEIAEWNDQTFATVYEFAKSLKTDEKKDGAKEGDTAGTAAATTQAQKTLEGAKEGTDAQADVTNTPGDKEPEGDKLQKAAAKLQEVLLKGRHNKVTKSPNNSKKE